ncbi:L-threonylcarbamoyladenylate synthase [Actinomyces procaprae]|uniref:L-threonylcarbamoyladenylate synthase n=1 Tax=Actinomyces procaprae TaxID=2560010 RepID=UPI00109E2D2B
MTAVTQQAPSDSMPEQIVRAAAHVAAGGLLALPTDTVYGLGVRADDADAVSRLLAVKGRGRAMPPPVLIASASQLDGVVACAPEPARALMEAFWPGALTLVLDAAPGLDWDLGETGGTIAVRMPDHPLALAVLHATGPMAVTSANATGRPPATDAAGVRAAFPGRVVDAGDAGAEGPTAADILLLDGGPTPGAVPSTIVSLAGTGVGAPEVLREGVISRAQLEGAGA